MKVPTLSRQLGQLDLFVTFSELGWGQVPLPEGTTAAQSYHHRNNPQRQG